MRNEPIAACKGKQHSCASCDFSVRPGHGMQAKPGPSKRRDLPRGPWSLHQVAHLEEQTVPRLCCGSCSSTLDPKEECCTDFISSRKRARSSSFTFQKSSSQPNTVKKNNIFMTAALLQRNPDFMKSTKEGSLSPSQLRNVIRPAILQPPQALTCPENPVVSLVTKKEACVQGHRFMMLPDSPSHEKKGKNMLIAKESGPVFYRAGWATCKGWGAECQGSKEIRSQLLEERSDKPSSNSDFVFGENMVERVLSPGKDPKLCNEADLYKGAKTSMYIGSSHVSSQTKRALLRNATLIESAAAFISKPVEKILLDKVEVITGEESEHNVLQINCKLFVFNKLSLTWTERGRGSLRLNDTSSNKCGMLQSRLIMRNQGSLRLILNTRLWEQMVIKRVNRKSLCFTATDQEDHSVQVFLTQAGSKDTEDLYAAIHHRLVALRSFAEQEPDANQVDTEPEIVFQPLNCDSDDEDDEKIMQVSSSGSGKQKFSWKLCNLFKKPCPCVAAFFLEDQHYSRTGDPQFKLSKLALKGSNYAGLLERHRIHTKNVQHIVDSLRNERIEVRLVKRREYNEETVRWADAVISAGGDGTMLLAASKVFDKFKPVIGVNTDPERSEGHLCLPVRYTHSFPEALQKLYRGEFRWQWRQRIRLYLEGTGINTTPVDLHEQQLSQEQHSRAHINERFQDQRSDISGPHLLPVRALNEVFIGESLSSRENFKSCKPSFKFSLHRASYYEMSVDDGPWEKQKSSGLNVCTGTGSKAWSYNINKVAHQAIEEIVKIVTNDYNESLLYSPEEPKMFFSVREPIVNRVFSSSRQRGFSSKVCVRSRCWDACMVVDGGTSFEFNDGAIASILIDTEDALCTVLLEE
ncbi:ran-binding protein 3-like isoform a [Willisornis vidua]|uniref:NAD(+) kinase n=1 Tax=Willisornis vidua TaxID=1566151 RepID=A0ABQ9D9Y0_9PASS|nr:ran-binding protein 3-like isoform a [Willisornis vidua]